MFNKIMAAIGVLLSLLLFYFCFAFQGNGSKEIVKSDVQSQPAKEIAAIKSGEELVESENAKEQSENVNLPSSAEREKVAAAAVQKEPAMFDYEAKNGVLDIKAVLSKEDENSDLIKEIDNICKNVECNKDITFKEDREAANWRGFALSIVSFFKDNGVEGAKLFIEGKRVEVAGVLPSEDAKNRLASLLEPFKNEGFEVDDQTNIKIVENENVQSPVNGKETAISESKESEEKVKQTEEEIAKLLSLEPVRFKLNSFQLTPESEKTLQKAVKLLDSLGDDVEVEVAGYTDSRGSKSYNLRLSQKRAEAVKAYLEAHMKTKKNIVAKGYGASDFVIADNPRDKRNRRVEIHLRKGN